MKVQVLSSGSKGNCTILLCDGGNIIIDMGISYTSLKRKLEEENLSYEDFAGVLITHAHKDHISGLNILMKHTNLCIYIPKKMYQELKEIVPEERCIFIEDNFKVVDVNIELIHTSHDADCSVGYIISYKDKSLVYVTDTGYINRKYLAKMISKDLYIIESNHDEVMLMDGPYPRFLKERMVSDRGHLSNHTTARYLKKVIGENTKTIILAHLSEVNNKEEIAIKTVKEAIEKDTIKIITARQKEATDLIEV